MRRPPTPSRPLIAAVASILAVAAAAHAQSVFDDFSSGNDNAWTRIDATGIYAGAPSTYSVTSGQYRIQQPAYNPVFGTLPVGSHRVDGFALNSQISVDVADWSDNTNNVITISSRLSQPTASTFQFYTLSFFPTSGAGDGSSLSNLRIDRWNANLTIDSVTPFSTEAFPRVSNAGTYRLVFTLMGASLTGQLFDISGTSPLLIKTVGATDTNPLGPGIPGLGVYGNGGAGPADATFDNFRVVPAPGAAALLSIGGLLAARRRRSAH